MVTQDLMTDPVQAADGHAYDRSGITTWFETRERARLPLTSPKTGLELASTTLQPAAQQMKLLDELRGDFIWDNCRAEQMSVGSDIFGHLDKLLH